VRGLVCEPIDEAAAADQSSHTTVDLGLERSKILGKRERAIDRLRLRLRVKESLHAIDPTLIDEQVFSTADGRHDDILLGRAV
jgi:hypothetical protein